MMSGTHGLQRKQTTVEDPISGHAPLGSRKSVCNWSRPVTGMCKIQSLYELEFKQGFVKAAVHVSRVDLSALIRECLKII